MGAPDPNGEKGTARGKATRGRSRSPMPGSLAVIDRLSDSFPLLPGESQWLMAVLADDLARILADD